MLVIPKLQDLACLAMAWIFIKHGGFAVQISIPFGTYSVFLTMLLFLLLDR